MKIRVGISRLLIFSILISTFTLISATSAQAAVGEFDSALTLDGTKYASVTDTTGSVWDVNGNFTIEAWVKPTSCSSDSIVISKLYEFMLYCGGGTWKTLDVATGTGWNGVALSSKAVANEWHHVAISHGTSGTALKFYYDGVNVETVTTASTYGATPNDQPIQVGSYLAGSLFNGQIDELRIFNTQHSDAQVATEMNTYGPLNASDLVAYYDMNDQSGSTINNIDASPASGTNLTMSSGSAVYTAVESATVINGDLVVKFPRTYLTSLGGWKIPSTVSTIRALVVGGGGAGGSRAGAGGGAGGYVYESALSVPSGSIQSIIVGTGGKGFLSRKGNNGTDSKLGALRIAMGGGAGGTDNLPDGNGSAGGSGGGGGAFSGTINGSPSLQFSTYGYGQGSSGGAGYGGNNWPGGGGGGANLTTGTGGSGTSTSEGGKGGDGVTDPIAGTTTCYATGGGGGSANTAGAGGNCGGTASVNNNAAGTAGTVNWPGAASANTGSGGGGGSWAGVSDPVGGYGANGVIIIRYALAMTVTASFSGGAQATYRTSGSISVTAALPGKVTFYERGKLIPGCRNVATDGNNVATCTWRPSTHGSVTITATARPTNTYVPNGTTSLKIGVVKRSNNR